MRVLLAVLVGAAIAGPTWGACSVREETVEGVRFIVMENEVIVARVLPAMGGALSDLELKGHGPLLAPARITREQVIAPVPVYREERNGWGLTDWFYPGGAYSMASWEASIVEDTPASCAVQVRHEMVARTVRIREGSAGVEVEVTITNTGEADFGRSYWLHGMYRLGGAAELTGGTQRLFVPIAATTERRRTLAEVSAEPLLLDDAPQERWSRFLAPAQPWMALVDRTRALGVATVLSPASFSDQVLAYSWAGGAGAEAAITQEMVLESRALAPGASTTHAWSLLPFAGLTGVDYVNAELALAMESPDGPQRPGPLQVSVRVVTDRPRAIALELVLQAEAGPVRSETLELADVGPSSARNGVVSFGMVPPGEYTVAVSARDGAGAVIAEDALWAQRVAVR